MLRLGPDRRTRVAAAVNAGDVINHGEVVAQDGIYAAPQVSLRARSSSRQFVKRELRLRLIVRLCQPVDGPDEWIKCGRDRGLRHRREPRLSSNAKAPKAGMKRIAHHRRRARGLNNHPARRNRIDLEPLACEPRANGSQIILRRSKKLSNLLRRQPLVMQRRAEILLVSQELFERGLGCGIATQNDGNVNRRAQIDRPLGRLVPRPHPCWQLFAQACQLAKIRIASNPVSLLHRLQSGNHSRARLRRKHRNKEDRDTPHKKSMGHSRAQMNREIGEHQASDFDHNGTVFAGMRLRYCVATRKASAR